MKIRTRFGMGIAPRSCWSGTAPGQGANPPTHQGAPRMVEGRVIKIDRTQGG